MYVQHCCVLDSILRTCVYVRTLWCCVVCEWHCLHALQGLSDVFDCTPHLWKLDLTGNPLAHHAKYRDKVITMVKGIGEYGEWGQSQWSGQNEGKWRSGIDHFVCVQPSFILYCVVCIATVMLSVTIAQ